MSMTYPSEAFEEAATAMCHGTISEEQLAQLTELLKENEAAQAAYLWHVEMHQGLRAELTRKQKANANSPHPRQGRRPQKVKTPFLSRFSTLAAAAILIIAAGVTWTLLNRTSTNPDPDQNPGNIAALPEAKIGQITQLLNPKWEGRRFIAGDALHEKQALSLEAGTADITLSTGAVLKLIAPVKIEIKTAKRTRLIQGSVAAIVETPQAKGFTIETDQATFVDLGTRFSVTIGAQGGNHLVVTEGSVEATHTTTKQKSLVKAGETFTFKASTPAIRTRIEAGQNTPEFRFPTITPPSREDHADVKNDKAHIYVWDGRLRNNTQPKNPSALRDGSGQQDPTSETQAVFFNQDGDLMMDLGELVTIEKINTYAWYQGDSPEKYEERVPQQFELYGHPDGVGMEKNRPLLESGWIKITSVNSLDHFPKGPDHPAQTASSVYTDQGALGQYRYLLWRTKGKTYFSEFDVYAAP